MVTLTVAPRNGENLYGLLVAKEIELRRNRMGTLHRKGKKRRGHEVWEHKSYTGTVRFERTIGGTVAAAVQSSQERDEWQLLTSFIGFIHRHFAEHVGSILLTYGG